MALFPFSCKEYEKAEGHHGEEYLRVKYEIKYFHQKYGSHEGVQPHAAGVEKAQEGNNGRPRYEADEEGASQPFRPEISLSLQTSVKLRQDVVQGRSEKNTDGKDEECANRDGKEILPEAPLNAGKVIVENGDLGKNQGNPERQMDGSPDGSELAPPPFLLEKVEKEWRQKANPPIGGNADQEGRRRMDKSPCQGPGNGQGQQPEGLIKGRFIMVHKNHLGFNCTIWGKGQFQILRKRGP